MTEKIKYDDKFTWGLQLGIDVPARKGIAFYGGLRWMNLDAEASNAGGNRDLDLSPFMWNAGISYRF